jgi:hypothetical protein
LQKYKFLDLQYAGGCFDQMKGQHRSCPFSQAQAQIEQRVQAQGIPDGLVPDLHGAVRSNQVGLYVRDQFCGDQGSRAQDEAIHNHGNPPGGRADDHAGQPGNLYAAHLGKHVQRVLWIGRIEPDCCLDDLDLLFQAGIVNAGAAACDLFHRQAGQHSHNGGRSRGNCRAMGL